VVEMGSNVEEHKNSDRTEIIHYHEGTSPVFESHSKLPSPSVSVITLNGKMHSEDQKGPDQRQSDIMHYHHGEHRPIAPVSNSAVSAAYTTGNPVKQKVDVAHYHHGISPLLGPHSNPVTLSVVSKLPPFADARIRSSSLTSNHSESAVSDTQQREEEICIAALLGDHMPGAEIPMAGEPSGSVTVSTSNLLSYFMSLRLLLLRAPERRTEEENALLDIIKRSHRGFSRDSARGMKEIANLLVKDWQFLKSSDVQGKSPTTAPSVPQSEGMQQQSQSWSYGKYQSHVLNAPSISTHSSNGAPITMPPLRLGNADVTSINYTAFDTDGMFKKRRISGDD
jgi:hypothetical protein